MAPLSDSSRLWRKCCWIGLFVDGKNGNLPDFVSLTICCDHASGLSQGYPTPRAQVADNDLALGRIVQAISQSFYWKETAIFVVEDDSQAGVDHVDGHRAPVLVVSPYVKRGAIDSTYYTQIDVVRTIEQILGLPPMNQRDLAAAPMRTVFTDEPNLTPYTVVPNQIAINEMVPATSASAFERAWKSVSAQMFAARPAKADTQDENLLNRAIWYGTMGFKKPYPGDTKVLLPKQVSVTHSTA